MSAISTVYNWPRNYLASTAKFYPASGSLFSTSPYTGRTRVSQTQATPWMAELTFSLLDEDKWGEIRATLLRLCGTLNQVRLFDPAHVRPRGIAAGVNRDNPLGGTQSLFSDGTSFTDGTTFRDGSETAQLARSHLRGERNVLLQGLVPSQAVSLRMDDSLQVGDYMYSCLATVSSNSAGQALVPIAPALRDDVPYSSSKNVVNFIYPTSPFMLASDFQGITVEAGQFAQIGVKFIEVLP